jgi:hypothetical protein
MAARIIDFDLENHIINLDGPDEAVNACAHWPLPNLSTSKSGPANVDEPDEKSPLLRLGKGFVKIGKSTLTSVQPPNRLRGVIFLMNGVATMPGPVGFPIGLSVYKPVFPPM